MEEAGAICGNALGLHCAASTDSSGSPYGPCVGRGWCYFEHVIGFRPRACNRSSLKNTLASRLEPFYSLITSPSPTPNVGLTQCNEHVLRYLDRSFCLCFTIT
jgi:hypothetical protein